MAVARHLDVDEAYLCPQVPTAPTTQSASVAELLKLHPSRSAVPHDLWHQLITGTREALDVLVYAGTFLFEQHDLVGTIRDRAEQGVRVRILLGDETAARGALDSRGSCSFDVEVVFSREADEVRTATMTATMALKRLAPAD